MEVNETFVGQSSGHYVPTQVSLTFSLSLKKKLAWFLHKSMYETYQEELAGAFFSNNADSVFDSASAERQLQD